MAATDKLAIPQETADRLTAAAAAAPSAALKAIQAERRASFGFSGALRAPQSSLALGLTGARAAFAVCEQVGLRGIAARGTRVVVRVGSDLVAKIGWRPRWGTVYNRNEAQVWDAAPADARVALADVVGLLNADVLVQRLAQPLSPTDLAGCDAELTEQKARLRKIGITGGLAPSLGLVLRRASPPRPLWLRDVEDCGQGRQRRLVQHQQPDDRDQAEEAEPAQQLE